MNNSELGVPGNMMVPGTSEVHPSPANTMGPLKTRAQQMCTTRISEGKKLKKIAEVRPFSFVKQGFIE